MSLPGARKGPDREAGAYPPRGGTTYTRSSTTDHPRDGGDMHTMLARRPEPSELEFLRLSPSVKTFPEKSCIPP